MIFLEALYQEVPCTKILYLSETDLFVALSHRTKFVVERT